GNYDRTLQGAPEDDYVWTFDFQPENDDLADAQRIQEFEGSASGNNKRAVDEVDEPDALNRAGIYLTATLWYHWTAPADGWVTFDLSPGTKINTTLGVFRGTNYEELIELASNNNFGNRKASRVSLAVQADASYSAVVAGDFDDNAVPGDGDFTLRWYPTPPPNITSFTPAISSPGQVITLNGTNFTGVTQVTLNGQPATFAFSTNADFLDLRLLVTVPVGATSGLFRVETPHGDTTATTEFTVIPIPALVVEAVTESTLILSWPDDAIGFALEARDTLESNPGWQPVSLDEIQPPTPGRVTVADSLSRGVRLYRLRRP
ncbi:MAG TPA: hypothetical protein DCE44_01000, partial [Verrucomicrobiales bacterium]|nr:hypothetical protein [Verrucomicrobiales bacterium]